MNDLGCIIDVLGLEGWLVGAETPRVGVYEISVISVSEFRASEGLNRPYNRTFWQRTQTAVYPPG